MKKKITITVEAPIPCTEEQFEEWVLFGLGYAGDIDMSNPLSGYQLEADDVEFN